MRFELMTSELQRRRFFQTELTGLIGLRFFHHRQHFGLCFPDVDGLAVDQGYFHHAFRGGGNHPISNVFCYDWMVPTVRPGEVQDQFLHFTLLSLGLAFFAALDAPLELAAKMAPAALPDTPSFLDIEAATFLKPGCLALLAI